MLTEVALQHRVIPGIAEFARGGLPAPASTDDGNKWVDGHCWLYCGHQWTRVLWIGPASVADVQAPMYACGACIRALQERVWQSISVEDEPVHHARSSQPATLESPPARRAGRHRGQSRFLRRG